jgi:hypothetical protein
MLLCWSSALSAPGDYLGRLPSHQVFGHQHGAGEGVETGLIPSSGGPEWGVHSHATDDRVEEESDRDSDGGWDEDDETGMPLVDL